MLYLQQGAHEALAAHLKGSDPSDKAVSDPDSPTQSSRPDESTASGKAHPSTEREENAQSAEAQLLQAVSAPAPVVDPTADIALQGVDISVQLPVAHAWVKSTSLTVVIVTAAQDAT